MLAFDLETTGIDPTRDMITCAAVYDQAAGIERVFFFARLDERGKLVPVLDDAGAFMRFLDDADRICAFNGARFDLPFIRHQLGASREQLAGWREKLHDVYEGCRLALCVSFSLKELLELNGLPGKTGSGLDAISLAQRGEWDRLGEYCLNDTRVTHAVSSLDRILVPRTRGVCMDSRGNFSAS